MTVQPGLDTPVFTWSTDGTTLTISHANMLGDTVYSPAVGTGAMSAAGAVLAAAYTWQFTTASYAEFVPDQVSANAGVTFTTPHIVLNDPSLPQTVTLNIGIPQGMTVDTAVSNGNLACVEPGQGVSQFFSEWNAQTRQIAVTATIASPAVGVEIVKSITLTDATSAGATNPRRRLRWSGGSYTELVAR